MFRTNYCRPMRKFGAICLMLLQALMPCAAMAQVGQGGSQGAGATPPVGQPSAFVNSASGDVFMRTGTGEQVPVKPGDVFASGTVFTTGTGAEVVLLFADGQHVSLGAGSTFRVDEYQFDARDVKASRASFALVAGTMRLVTGAIQTANPDASRISMGDTVIGILSRDVTSFVVDAGTTSQAGGSVAVIVGEISIRAPVGPIVSVAADQFTRWQTGVATAAPQPLAAAPAVLQAAAASRATLQGASVPLNVEAAAALAVALANLPAAGAGSAQEQGQAQAQAQALAQAEQAVPAVLVAAILPPVTPGAAGGCVGSPC